jgi:predicted nuclease of restriction endonuclease-like (RecB) superfamily
MANSKIDSLDNPIAIIQQAIDLIQNARQKIVRQTNSLMVFTYFQIGQLIVEQEQKGKQKAAFGQQTLLLLSKSLVKEFGRGFSVDNLENMRKFYLTFSISETASRKLKPMQVLDKKSETVSRRLQENYFKKFSERFQLSWSHYVILSRIDEGNERSFYEIESIQNIWSVRELQRQLESGLFERLTLSKSPNKVKELAKKGHIIEKPEDVLKTPYVLEFLGLDEKISYSETDLETAIINKIEHFLLEMGKGFLFQGRQVRFSLEEENFYVDLVLYNRLLQCFVLIDLKIGKLRHQDIGQMQMYVNYYDRFIKQKFEKPTIGIIICKDKSDAVVEITLPKDNKQIFASQYKLFLPSKAILKKLVTE